MKFLLLTSQKGYPAGSITDKMIGNDSIMFQEKDLKKNLKKKLYDILMIRHDINPWNFKEILHKTTINSILDYRKNSTNITIKISRYIKADKILVAGLVEFKIFFEIKHFYFFYSFPITKNVETICELIIYKIRQKLTKIVNYPVQINQIELGYEDSSITRYPALLVKPFKHVSLEHKKDKDFIIINYALQEEDESLLFGEKVA